MKTCQNWPIGICSWSLQKDLDGVAESMKTLGVEHVHLALRAGLEGDEKEFEGKVKQQGWTISCAMIDFPTEDYSTMESIRKTGGVAPDNAWETNRKLFAGAAKMAKRLGVKYLSMHAGFSDERDHAYARKMTDRIRMLADLAGANGIQMLMETGQESAEELKHFIESLKHPAVGVNFDPANMIMYDKGDPVKALEVVGKWVRHIHIKDAIRTNQPGTWGTEVPWGEGQVNHPEFFAVLKRIGYKGCLAVEREAGENRLDDIQKGIEQLVVQ